MINDKSYWYLSSWEKRDAFFDQYTLWFCDRHCVIPLIFDENSLCVQHLFDDWSNSSCRCFYTDEEFKSFLNEAKT